MVVKCLICNKVFTQQNNLNRHYKNVHKSENSVSYNFNVFQNKCLDGCNCSFKTLKELRVHLENVHNLDMNKENLEFKTFEGNRVPISFL